MNVMRASKTLIFSGVDTVYSVEDNIVVSTKASLLQPGGVCGAGMHETAQPRNLGDPDCSCKGNYEQRIRAHNDGNQEVRLLHSTGETE